MNIKNRGTYNDSSINITHKTLLRHIWINLETKACTTKRSLPFS